MNNFNELIKKFQEQGLAQNNTKVELPETPQYSPICRGYNNHFGLYNNTNMCSCNYEYVNKETQSLFQVPYFMITGSAVLNKAKFDNFLRGGCMPYGWTKSTINGLNYKSVNEYFFDNKLFGCHGFHNNQPAYFVFGDSLRSILCDKLGCILSEITGNPQAIDCLYPTLNVDGCSQCFTSLGESKIDTKQFENKSVFEIAELFGDDYKAYVMENKLLVSNNTNKYVFDIVKD